MSQDDSSYSKVAKEGQKFGHPWLKETQVKGETCCRCKVWSSRDACLLWKPSWWQNTGIFWQARSQKFRVVLALCLLRKMFPLLNAMGLFTPLRVRCILKSPECWIFGAVLKTTPKTLLPIEINGNRSKSELRFVCLLRFLSHRSVFTGAGNAKMHQKCTGNAYETHQFVFTVLLLQSSVKGP